MKEEKLKSLMDFVERMKNTYKENQKLFFGVIGNSKHDMITLLNNANGEVIPEENDEFIKIYWKARKYQWRKEKGKTLHMIKREILNDGREFT